MTAFLFLMLTLREYSATDVHHRDTDTDDIDKLVDPAVVVSATVKASRNLRCVHGVYMACLPWGGMQSLSFVGNSQAACLFGLCSISFQKSQYNVHTCVCLSI